MLGQGGKWDILMTSHGSLVILVKLFFDKMTAAGNGAAGAQVEVINQVTNKLCEEPLQGPGGERLSCRRNIMSRFSTRCFNKGNGKTNYVCIYKWHTAEMCEDWFCLGSVSITELLQGTRLPPCCNGGKWRCNILMKYSAPQGQHPVPDTRCQGAAPSQSRISATLQLNTWSYGRVNGWYC